VLPLAARDDQTETTVLSMSEETARVMFLLLKAQLAAQGAQPALSRFRPAKQ
jgi:hypothetical protein